MVIVASATAAPVVNRRAIISKPLRGRVCSPKGFAPVAQGFQPWAEVDERMTLNQRRPACHARPAMKSLGHKVRRT